MKEIKKQPKIVKENPNLPVPANSLEKYLVEISNYKILSREKEIEYALDYRETGNVESARKLITSNLRFVVKIAMEYQSYGLNIMDIIQEGNLGLMKAVTKFDPTKRYRLISYGVWWIRAYIQNFIMKNWSLIKIGTIENCSLFLRPLAELFKSLMAIILLPYFFVSIAFFVKARLSK